jgi:hypothetical protein
LEKQQHPEQRREVLRSDIQDHVQKLAILKALEDIEKRLLKLEEKFQHKSQETKR